MSNIENYKDVIISFIKKQANGKSFDDKLEFLLLLQVSSLAFHVQILKSSGMSKVDVLNSIRENTVVNVCAFYDAAITPNEDSK